MHCLNYQGLKYRPILLYITYIVLNFKVPAMLYTIYYQVLLLSIFRYCRYYIYLTLPIPIPQVIPDTYTGYDILNFDN